MSILISSGFGPACDVIYDQESWKQTIEGHCCYCKWPLDEILDVHLVQPASVSAIVSVDYAIDVLCHPQKQVIVFARLDIADSSDTYNRLMACGAVRASPHSTMFVKNWTFPAEADEYELAFPIQTFHFRNIDGRTKTSSPCNVWNGNYLPTSDSEREPHRAFPNNTTILDLIHFPAPGVDVTEKDLWNFFKKPNLPTRLPLLPDQIDLIRSRNPNSHLTPSVCV